jgi:hypothetical protein
MSIYNFSFEPRAGSPPGAVERSSIMPKFTDIPDRTKKSFATFDKVNVNIEDVKEVLTKGFFVFDEGMKNWLSNIEVPTKDGMKKLTVRVPRLDKTVLVWRQELHEGRISLPVASVIRNSAAFNAQKFSPAYHYMRLRTVDSTRSRASQIFRPTPFLAEYQISIWTEWKQDAEYITHQILTRFSPLAEFRVSDEHLQGQVIVKLNGWSDVSDVESAKDAVSKVRYDISTSAEVWLPLPERLVPLIRGRVSALQETSGEILSALQGTGIVPVRL